MATSAFEKCDHSSVSSVSWRQGAAFEAYECTEALLRLKREASASARLLPDHAQRPDRCNPRPPTSRAVPFRAVSRSCWACSWAEEKGASGLTW